MKADVRVVRLMRKIIRDQKEMQTMGETEHSNYFATDYFDVMKVERKELSSPLTSIMGIWPDEKMDILDVAAQSYSLYCSAEMMELEKGKEECGDPFVCENIKMQFLSMIQVHITPEVIAHALPTKNAEELIDAVYQDLFDAVSEFADTSSNGLFVFRIYKMLSAGDFAVVLRSAEAETSFKVSSLLRRRVMAGSSEKKIVLYKTYTLLTFGNDIIRQEIEEQRDDINLSQVRTTGNDRFVLRCCYSNLYWSNKEKVDEYLKAENIFSGIQLYGLNGRYDFSVRITDMQFLELLNDIKAYKETGIRSLKDKSMSNGSASAVKNEDGIVKYLKYLMDNNFLSYINERYLVAQDGNVEESSSLLGNKASLTVYATSVESRKKFLDYKISEMYDLIEEKCKKMRQKVNGIKDYRKNMKHYANLLDKLIKLCYGINGFSDTRIYAAVLLEQLDVVMDSITVYMEMYHQAEEEKEEILYLLEEYIRESVCALDGYAQYIRNNNLQSLQTPNYNIESNMSMEKLLIGYSEFLKVFTEFYQRTKKDMIKIDNPCEYLPIVVPVLSERDVSVETLFHKGVMNDWNKEKEIRSTLNIASNRCCMVISVPTLTELGNVRTMITSLFHEVAHQFRYETRKERNDALLKYVVRTIMRDIINKLIQKLQNDTGLRDWNIDVGRRLEMSLVEAYMETNYINDEGILEYSFQEAPLTNFQYCLNKDLYEVLGVWELKDDIRSVFHAFLKEIMYHYQPEGSKCPEAIHILDELIGQIELKKSKEGLDEEIVKCAYGLSWECACQNIDNSAMRIWEDIHFGEWIANKAEIEYEAIWNKTFRTMESDKKSEIQKIWNNFFRFSSWIYDYCGSKEKIKIYNSKKKTRFLKKAYQKMCLEWIGNKIQEDLSSDFDSTLSFMGRALGIDCNTKENYRMFEEQISFVVNQNLKYIADMAEWRIGKYREETADMFMCNAMRLTPFGYMHMLAVGWPSNQELPNEYYSRSQNILLFQWCLDEEYKLSYSKFRELCVRLIEMLEGAIYRSSQRLIKLGEQLELLQHFNEPLIWDSKDEKQVSDILERIEGLNYYCDYVEGKIVEWNNSHIKRECEMLKFYGIMAHMLDQLVDHGMEQIAYLNDFKELRDDYIRGIKQLKNLNDEMCNDENPLVQQLGEFCKEISILQNEPYLLVECDEENRKMNESSIEFLLRMYYVNKRRVAQQIGGE